MRSVFVFTDTPAGLLRSLLRVDETVENRVIQEVRIEDPPNWADGWDDPHLLRHLTQRFGHLPKRLVVADISGRSDGRAEALAVINTIRTLGSVAVFDDWSVEPWTDQELLDGHTSTGRRFLSPL